MNTADPVEFVVAAFGLKAAAIAGRRGAGVISFGLLDPGAWTAFDATRREAARETGQPEEVDSYVMTSLHRRPTPPGTPRFTATTWGVSRLKTAT